MARTGTGSHKIWLDRRERKIKAYMHWLSMTVNSYCL